MVGLNFIQELIDSLEVYHNDVELSLINGDKIKLKYIMTTVFNWGISLTTDFKTLERIYIPFDSIVYFKVLSKKRD